MPIARSPPRPAELTAGGVGAGRNLARRDSARPDDRMPTSGGLGTPTSDDAAGLAAEGRFLIPCWRGSRCRSGSGFWERPIVAPLLIGLALGPSNADSVGDLARVLSTASTRRYRTATSRRSGFAVAGDRASGLAPRSGRLAALLPRAPRRLGPRLARPPAAPCGGRRGSATVPAPPPAARARSFRFLPFHEVELPSKAF